MSAAGRQCSPQITHSMQVLVAADDLKHSHQLQSTLRAAGYSNVTHLGSMTAARGLGQTSEQLLVYYASQLNATFIHEMHKLGETPALPVVVFVEQSDVAAIVEATRLGVHSLIVNGLSADRIDAIFAAAMARFQQQQQVRAELAKAKKSLDERKAIDRAKGLLIDKHRMSESEAYSSLRKMAMDQGKTIAEVAADVISMLRVIG